MNEHIMMIHGMWCGDWVWDNYKRFFEPKGYHCITPTLRFHDKKSREVSYDQLGTTSLLDTNMSLDEGTYVNANLNIGESQRPLWVQGRVVRSTGKGMAMKFSHAELKRLNTVFPA